MATPQITPGSTDDLERQASQIPQQLGQALQNQQQAQQPQQQQQQQQQPQQQGDPLDQVKQSLAQQYQQLQRPPASGGPVRQLLQNFLGGMGSAMQHEAGVPTNAQKQQQILGNLASLTNAQAMQQLHGAMAAQYAPVPLVGMDGKPITDSTGQTIQLPANHAQTFYAGQAAAASRIQVQGMKGDTATDIANPTLTSEQAQSIGHPELANQTLPKALGTILQNQAGKVPITPDMVSKYNIPAEAVGKYAKLSDILSAERMSMTRQSQTWKETSPGTWEALPVTSTRTFGKGAAATPGAPRASAPAGAVNPATGGGQAAPAPTRPTVYGGGPIYAFDPKTNDTVMTTPQEAQQQGYTNPRKVTQTNIENDRQLNNRLYDVTAKIGRYEQSVNQPISALDRAKLSDIISDDKLHLGAFGFNVPTDWLSQLTKSMSTAGLSKPAQDRLINYYNVREAMTGYTRVLTGSGRSSETNLNLNLQAMPSPIQPDDFIKNGIGQFKQNVKIAGQGLPRMPGIQRAQDLLEPQQQQGSAPSVRFKEGNDLYDIPANRMADFRAKHPQAVPANGR